jgi:hypothetical protein
MKPKKLNLREIHSLYILLRSCLPHKEEEYLIDEISRMIEMMESGDTLIQAIEIMYPKRKFNRNNAMELLLLFTRGLKEIEFFEYILFINGMKRG